MWIHHFGTISPLGYFHFLVSLGICSLRRISKASFLQGFCYLEKQTVSHKSCFPSIKWQKNMKSPSQSRPLLDCSWSLIRVYRPLQWEGCSPTPPPTSFWVNYFNFMQFFHQKLWPPNQDFLKIPLCKIPKIHTHFLKAMRTGLVYTLCLGIPVLRSRVNTEHTDGMIC